MNRKAPLAVMLVVAMLTFGCKDPYGSCSKAGADIAGGITAADKTVLQLEQDSLISKTEAVNILGYLEFANKGDEAFLTCAKAAHDSGGKKGSYSACAAIFASTINNPANLQLIHVTNPQSQATVSALVNGISAGVAAIAAALGGQ